MRDIENGLDVLRVAFRDIAGGGGFGEEAGRGEACGGQLRDGFEGVSVLGGISHVVAPPDRDQANGDAITDHGDDEHIGRAAREFPGGEEVAQFGVVVGVDHHRIDRAAGRKGDGKRIQRQHAQEVISQDQAELVDVQRARQRSAERVERGQVLRATGGGLGVAHPEDGEPGMLADRLEQRRVFGTEEAWPRALADVENSLDAVLGDQGYDDVTAPAFVRNDVWERGLGIAEEWLPRTDHFRLGWHVVWREGIRNAGQIEATRLSAFDRVARPADRC